MKQYTPGSVAGQQSTTHFFCPTSLNIYEVACDLMVLVPHVMMMSCVLDLKCQFHFVVHNNLFLWQSIKNCTESWHAWLQRRGRGSRRTECTQGVVPRVAQFMFSAKNIIWHQDLSMHAWNTCCSKYFASNDEQSPAVSRQCMFDVKSHPARPDVKMGKWGKASC